MENIEKPPITVSDEKPAQNYVIPQKLIKGIEDMPKWEKSEAYYDLVGFIGSVAVAIQGTKLSQQCETSFTVEKLLEVLKKLERMAIETPPIDQPQRFGNTAFRTWFQKMKDNSLNYIKESLPEHLQNATPELALYFTESFGNPTRIDYGTGHEMAFLMFLVCLFKIGALEKKDEMAVGVKLFQEYIMFARKLQVTYRMEPAGTHGVWSLDDYQFVPFIWGSAQLAVHSPIEPSQFVEDNIIDKYSKELMFVSCIDYIRQVKTGHFAEHSNQLWSISAVQSWSKISTGLIKMYQKEVLSKFPVIQHVFFGSILTLHPIKPGRSLPNPRLGMLPRAAPPPIPPKFDAPSS